MSALLLLAVMNEPHLGNSQIIDMLGLAVWGGKWGGEWKYYAASGGLGALFSQ